MTLTCLHLIQSLRSPLSLSLIEATNSMVLGEGDRAWYGGQDAEMAGKTVIHSAAVPEKLFYDTFVKVRPEFVTQAKKGSGETAKKMYGLAAVVGGNWSLSMPVDCKPDTKQIFQEGAGCVAAYEGKTMDEIAFEEGGMYSILALASLYFKDDSVTSRTFLSEPPLSFCTIGYGPIGCVNVFEMIGVLFYSPFSQPFFAASDRQGQATALIDTQEVRRRSSSQSIQVSWGVHENIFCCWGENKELMWTVRPLKDKFYKIISAGVDLNWADMTSQQTARPASNQVKATSRALTTENAGAATESAAAAAPSTSSTAVEASASPMSASTGMTTQKRKEKGE